MNEQIRMLLEAQDAFHENLIRAHFKETPIALACVERLKIMPWDIEVQRHQIGEDLDSSPEHNDFTIQIMSEARVVEYLPRRWELRSVQGWEQRRADYRFRLRHEFLYGNAVHRPDIFVKVVPS